MNPVTVNNRYSSYREGSGGLGAYVHRQNGYRQKTPYNLPLAYTKWFVQTTASVDGAGLAAAQCAPAVSYPTGKGAFSHLNGLSQSTSYAKALGLVSTSQNTARERFISKMKGSAGLGVDLIEYRQSMSMIERRATQFFDAIRVLRKGNISGAATILKIYHHPSYHRLVKDMTLRGELKRNAYKKRIVATRKYQRRLITSGDKAFADLFLELHFGWEPIVHDVYDCVDILSRPIPAGRFKGSHSDVLRDTRVDVPFPGGTNTSEHYIRCHTIVGATVRMNNPNIALANQVGVINPASLLFEVIPYSFVLGWFVNIQSFLESFTDTAGYTITDAYVQTTVMDNMTYYSADTFYNRPPWNSPLVYRFAQRSVSSNRTLGLPGVTLKTVDSVTLSPTRALTAVALLIQQGFRHGVKPTS